MPTLDKTVAIMHDAAGRRFRRIAKYTGPASYVTNGDPFDPKDVDLGVFDCAPALILWSGTATRLAVYDYTNKKYVWYVPDTGAEVANGTDLSTFSTRAEWVGY